MENDTNCFYDDYLYDNDFHDNDFQDDDFHDKKLSLEEITYLEKLGECELSEKDFYPPEDNRVLRSNVYDISGGDNFSDYAEYFFEICDEEEYFDM